MNLQKKQQGLSGLGWMLLILIVGGTATLGIRLIPHYVDFNTAAAILDGMSREQGLISKRTSDIEAMFKKRLKLNNIREFKLDERLTIKRASDRIIINLEYEVREPLVYNIHVLLTFKHNVQLRN
ncbi:MAG: DUF4845 domain-containing protein [Gammaproteobacteria bacterium]|nr:DUF4845 domain-containing protein [Gammaproteobacteria bacterium]